MDLPPEPAEAFMCSRASATSCRDRRAPNCLRGDRVTIFSRPLRLRALFRAALFIQAAVFSAFPSSARAFPSEAMNNSSSSCGSAKRVFVIGANGKTGYRLVRLLEQNPSYLPKAMVRDPSQGRRFDEIGVPWVAGDLELGAPSAADLEGSDAVIFAAGAGRDRPDIKKVTIDYLGAVRSAAAAQETRSVERFVLLSGINSDVEGTRRSASASGDDLLGPLLAWHRLKARSEAYLKTSHLHGRALDWTILCPGRLLDDEAGGPGTGQIKASLIHGEDDLKESMTQAEREAAAKSFPGSHDGKMERLCVSRDNTAAALVGLLGAPNTIGKSITIVDGILTVEEALSEIV